MLYFIENVNIVVFFKQSKIMFKPRHNQRHRARRRRQQALQVHQQHQLISNRAPVSFFVYDDTSTPRVAKT